jgi:CubicO group peptidase (beta-lactamase class C family)
MCLIASSTLSADVRTPEQPVTGARFGAVTSMMQDAVASGQVRGASLLVMKHGKVVFKEAVGNLTVDQRVRIASSSKPVSAVAIMTLVDDGVLSLNDPVSKFLPEFAKTKVASATLGQLLSHTAGMPDSYPGGRPKSGTLADFSKLIATRGNLDDPGSFRYSGVGIDIACRMAEAASGIPVESLIEKRVWQPLGMTHTSFTLAADPGTVPPEALAKGEGRYVSCGGGMSSTLDDMGAFYQMILQDGVYKGKRILSSKSLGNMLQKHSLNPRREGDANTTGEYGLAFYRDRVAPDGKPLTVSHGGSLGTMPWVDFDADLVGVFFSEARLRRVMPLIVQIQGAVREATSVGGSAREAAQGGASDGGGSGVGTKRREAVTSGAADSRPDPNTVFMRMSHGRPTVDREEFRDFVGGLPIGERLEGRPGGVDRLFDRLDANDDGQLTLEEYERIQELRRLRNR